MWHILWIHTHNRFTALWILSRSTWVSRYKKKHSPTHTHPSIPAVYFRCQSFSSHLLAHPGCPRQIPQRHKTVVCVCIYRPLFRGIWLSWSPPVSQQLISREWLIVFLCDQIMTHIEGVVIDVIGVILVHNISGKLSSFIPNYISFSDWIFLNWRVMFHLLLFLLLPYCNIHYIAWYRELTAHCGGTPLGHYSQENSGLFWYSIGLTCCVR